MTRNRVEIRANLIYRFLKDNLNKPYPIGDLLKATGLRDSHTTRAAIKRAWDLAEADGLFFPVACPANGQTYCVTDNPGTVLDPAIHLGSVAIGVEVRKDIHDAFMDSRRSKMTPAERTLLDGFGKYDEAQRAQREAQAAMLKAVVAMRREHRAGDGAA